MDETPEKICRPDFFRGQHEKEAIKLEILNVLNACQSTKDQAAAQTIVDIVEITKPKRDCRAVKFFVLGGIFVGFLCYLTSYIN